MSVLKKEMIDYISVLPDSALVALKPLLALLVAEESVIETDLTEEEKAIIRQGRNEYAKGMYVTLDSVL